MRCPRRLLACGVVLLTLAPLADAVGAIAEESPVAADGGAIVDFVRRLRIDEGADGLVVLGVGPLPRDARVALAPPEGEPAAWSSFIHGVARLHTSDARAWRGHARVADLHFQLRAPNGPDSAEFALDVLGSGGAGVRLGFTLALMPVTIDARVTDADDGVVVRVAFSRQPNSVEGMDGTAWERAGDEWFARIGERSVNDSFEIVAYYEDGARVVAAVAFPPNGSVPAAARTPVAREGSALEGALTAATFIGIGAVAAIVGARRFPRFRS